MQRKKLFLAILSTVLLVGAVSAAVIQYFGYVQIEATVLQSVRLNGNDWNVPTVYQPTVYGGDTWCTPWQTLSNDANVPITVKLETTISPTDGVTSWYTFYLSVDGSEYDGAGYSKWDRVVTAATGGPVNDITSLTFEYMLTEGGGHSPYFVLELDTDNDGVRDEWAVCWQDSPPQIVPINKWITFDGMWDDDPNNDGTPNPGKRFWFLVVRGIGGEGVTFDDIKYYVGTAKILAIKVAVGEWNIGWATTALVRTILVNGISAIDYGIVLPAQSASAVEGHVYFRVCVYFPPTTIGTFTITTIVKPA